MRITNLSVKGYRSFKDVSWKPGDLNVVIGPNGSGKSNLLRLLELISASATGRLSDYVLVAGGMEPLVWDGSTSSIEIGIDAYPLDPRLDPDKQDVRYDLRLARLGKTSAYRVEFEQLANFGRVRRAEARQPFKYIERHVLAARLFDEQQRSLVAPPESVREQESVLSQLADPFSQNQWASKFQAQLDGWCIYHDVRVDRDTPVRTAVVVRPEKRVAADAQNLVSVLHTLYTDYQGFRDDVDLAMRAAFSDDYRELQFAPASDGRVQLRVGWRSLTRAVSSADLSDGTLRFLFLIAVLAHPEPPPLVAIDEPETGLHPSMLPIVAEYAVDAATRTQVIFTTHSPQFLDAFRTEVPQTTVATWLDGQTKLAVLDGAELRRWLREFGLGSLFRSGELENMGVELAQQ